LTVNNRPEVFAWVAGLVALVAIVVLLAMRITVPSELWALVTLAFGGGLGLTNPGGFSSTPVAVAPHDQAAPSGL
jgi:hypothetical protein